LAIRFLNGWDGCEVCQYRLTTVGTIVALKDASINIEGMTNGLRISRAVFTKICNGAREEILLRG